ncbi:rRNA 2'-O-methyltransferase fibrillarin-like [Gossypium hirsutum]|uniref:rRNA 2'-O-methyltransferase fibrillarin-like n=1 Tax=Gossypium hirsutum TaxID=3635 RepID=A0ABM3AD51_GOSHI|nr:rRNA 2'-O-methyltransferase fibrillarin-like [Gossypium hirsutum]
MGLCRFCLGTYKIKVCGNAHIAKLQAGSLFPEEKGCTLYSPNQQVMSLGNGGGHGGASGGVRRVGRGGRGGGAAADNGGGHGGASGGVRRVGCGGRGGGAAADNGGS